jgi:putative ubiquitin-RnfH superfamily antitoxin RatB of RatAB toxin-antitoxin module
MRALTVSVVCAWPDQAWQEVLEVPEGCTVAQALARLPWQEVTGLDPAALRVGIFGRLVGMEEVLRPGDRIEFYRPLQVDPKQVRRERAERARQAGGRRQAAPAGPGGQGEPPPLPTRPRRTSSGSSGGSPP